MAYWQPRLEPRRAGCTRLLGRILGVHPEFEMDIPDELWNGLLSDIRKVQLVILLRNETSSNAPQPCVLHCALLCSWPTALVSPR